MSEASTATSVARWWRCRSQAVPTKDVYVQAADHAAATQEYMRTCGIISTPHNIDCEPAPDYVPPSAG